MTMGMNKDGKHKTYVLKYFNDHHITFYICIVFLFLVVKTTHEKNHRRIFGGQPPAVLFCTSVCLFPVAKENLIVSCCLFWMLCKNHKHKVLINVLWEIIEVNFFLVSLKKKYLLHSNELSSCYYSYLSCL